MSYRETNLMEGEFYHIYNRGVEKRNIFEEDTDYERFLDCLVIFNTEDIIGGIFEFEINQIEIPKLDEKLVDIVAYSLSPNHYHLILKQLKENGIAKFMHKIGMGHSKYFNYKYQRVGTLFQGRFKSIHINTDDYLSYLSIYVNLNNKIHTGSDNGLKYSSWGEYSSDRISKEKILCTTDIVLTQYKNKKDYKKAALELLPELLRQKKEKRELEGKELSLRQLTIEI